MHYSMNSKTMSKRARPVPMVIAGGEAGGDDEWAGGDGSPRIIRVATSGEASPTETTAGFRPLRVSSLNSTAKGAC